MIIVLMTHLTEMDHFVVQKFHFDSTTVEIEFIIVILVLRLILAAIKFAEPLQLKWS